MTDKEKENTKKPLLYIVQPNMPVPEQAEMQQEYRTARKKKNTDSESSPHPGGEEAPHTLEWEEPVTDKDKEEEDIRKKQADQEKMEKLKHETGIYKALGEIDAELASVRKIQKDLQDEGTTIIKENIPVKDGGSVKEIKALKPKTEAERRQRTTKQAISDLLGRSKQGASPLCEASINGRTVRFQLLGKRGDIVKIKTGSTIQDVPIKDLDHFKAL